MAHHLDMPNICAKLFKNASMHKKIKTWTQMVEYSHSSVTLTFEIGAQFFPVTQLFDMPNTCKVIQKSIQTVQSNGPDMNGYILTFKLKV